MAFVGSLSGSAGTTAITGSLIPGAATNSLGSNGAKWNTVYAQFLTGSLTKLSDGTEYLRPGSNITLTTGSNGSVTISSTGGGGGETVFTAASSTTAYTTSSIAIGFGAAASTKGSDVFFAVSGSTPGSNVSLFAGPVVATGSFLVKDAGNIVGQITETGAISGSALQTVGNLAVQGTSALIGNVTVTGDVAVNGGDLTTTSTGTATLFNTNATTVNIAGGATTSTTIGNATGGVTLNGTATVTGDLAVNGATSADITTTTTTATLFNTNATTVSIGGAATTLNIGSESGRVVIPGDLEVQGTTMTVSASNLVIEDPLVGFGFLSGSVATSAGDRGFIGGITGAGNNVAFGWSNSNSVFVATKTTSSPADTSITISALQPVRASKFEVNGAVAVVTSSDGSAMLLSGSTMTMSGSTVALDTGTAVNFTKSGTRVGQLIGNTSTDFKLSAMNGTGGATSLILSGSGVDIGANSQGVSLKFAGSTRGSFTYSSNTLTFGADSGIGLSLSASNGFNLTHGANGATFINNFGSAGYLTVEADGADARLRSQNDLVLRADGNDVKFNNSSQTVLTLTTAGNNANIQGANNQTVTIGSVGTTGVMNVSGSTVGINVGASGFKLYRDWAEALFINASGATTTISGSTSQNVTLAAGVGATTLEMSGSTTQLRGGVITMFQNATKVSEIATVDARTGFFPGADSSFDLGGPNRRWAHIYTGDLHLRNERGDYTLIEEPDFLSVRFNKNGKRYKFLLERVPELDETR